ncbi:15866_t:CDS:2, partial [Cetraspora pellucida]
VSSKTISKARAYCNINSPESLMHNKSTITRVHISPDPTRLLILEIKRELKQRGLSYNADKNKTNLISLLKENIQQKTSNMIKETVKEILKSFFHTNDENKSERYTSKEMLQDLQQREQIEKLETEEIPNLKMIEN